MNNLYRPPKGSYRLIVLYLVFIVSVMPSLIIAIYPFAGAGSSQALFRELPFIVSMVISYCACGAGMYIIGKRDGNRGK